MTEPHQLEYPTAQSWLVEGQMQFDQINRREFVTLLGGAAAWPLAARAQQPDRMRRIGLLTGFSPSDLEAQARISALRTGLAARGWVEARNLRIDERWAGANIPLLKTYV
jgi:putative ABC transport system substrate-binding protein